ncbi:MAG: adenylate/guanylate cyclase domain-containing protein, partial [Ilumatobacteraceae bacterium]|nr:adenylate/guanylate cyclase domain-containing protein [Ilumatobacteraceae bacterium]
MATLPSGVLTFVFTDIEGSTRLLRELGDGYDDVASLHDALLREVWQAHGVVEVATEGDAFFLVADDATPAVAAAAAAQRAIAEATWPHGVSLRIRIGVHTGYAVPSGDNYRALAVHRASRIVDAANGGQTLLTSDVVTRLGVVPMAQWRSLGRFQVRDFDEPIELWALDAEGTVTDPRPPRVRPADRHNLVRPTTSL